MNPVLLPTNDVSEAFEDFILFVDTEMISRFTMKTPKEKMSKEKMSKSTGRKIKVEENIVERK